LIAGKDVAPMGLKKICVVNYLELTPIAVRLRANVVASTAQIPPLRKYVLLIIWS